MKDRLYQAYHRFINHYSRMKKVNIWLYLKYNYFSSHIKRAPQVHIYPTRGAVLEFAQGSTLCLEGDLYLGFNQLRGSKMETWVRLRKNATMKILGTTYVYFGVSIDVFDHAELKILSAEINCFSTIMCHRSIEIGQDVLIARNVSIYDSDFHQTYNLLSGEEIALDAPISIGDHAWLCLRCVVLKGTVVSDYGVISANKKVQDVVIPSAPIRRC